MRSILIDLLITALVVWAFTQLVVPEIEGLLDTMTVGLELAYAR